MLTGGQRLRVIRKRCGETIENIATDAEITYKTLSEIERGITKQPCRENLNAILEALEQCGEVSTEDWQAVFEAYGYKKPCPLPVGTEIERAKQQWRVDYGHVTHPAYLIGFSERLLDWNKYAPRLLGLRYNDIRTRCFEGATMFDVTFNFSQGFITIENQAEYLLNYVYMTKSGLLPYKDESWYARRILTAQRKYPIFKQLWDSFPDDSFKTAFAGISIPIVLRLPEESDSLTFQFVKVAFAADERFLIIQWIPLDEITMRRCLAWVREESGVVSEM